MLQITASQALVKHNVIFFSESKSRGFIGWIVVHCFHKKYNNKNKPKMWNPEHTAWIKYISCSVHQLFIMYYFTTKYKLMISNNLLELSVQVVIFKNVDEMSSKWSSFCHLDFVKNYFVCFNPPLFTTIAIQYELKILIHIPITGYNIYEHVNKISAKWLPFCHFYFFSKYFSCVSTFHCTLLHFKI